MPLAQASKRNHARHGQADRRNGYPLLIVAALLFACVGSATGARAAVPLESLPAVAHEFLRSHCFDCHQGADGEAGLDLPTLLSPVAEAATGTDNPSADEAVDEPVHETDRWVRLIDRVRDREMPPRSVGELSAEEIDSFVAPLTAWLAGHQRAESESFGRVRGRRLTNLQLERTLHDLLGIDIPLAEGFSDEPRVGGFVSIADGQAMSHFQLEQHLRAVDLALDEAFRRVTTKPDRYEKKFSPTEIAKRRPGQRNREPELREDLAVVWSSRLIFYGRMAVTTAPTDGWYRFTIRASSVKQPRDYGVWCSVRSGPCVSSAPLLQTLGGFEATETPGEWTFEGWLPKGHMLEVRPADANLKLARFAGGQVGAGEGEPQDVPGVAIHEVVMERIHRGPDDDGVRRKLIGDLRVEPIDRGGNGGRGGNNGRGGGEIVSDQPAEDLARLIHRFATAAFRRPIDALETDPYVEIALATLADGEPFDRALRAGYRAVLCSPRFLYFSETPGQLDDHAIASRLSYFLWNRMPDETLLALADSGELRHAEVLRAQVRRMLTDPRGADFVIDFADQWLDLCDIDFTEPDPRFYKDFDPLVQDAMLAETRQYLQRMLTEDLGVSHLIDSDFTILNSRLARFYGIDGVTGDEPRLVSLKPEDRRGGLLTHGAILKVTANGTVTSPVIRGVWVSERLLGEHIPPPPSSVPAIEPDIRGATTIREQLDKHKSSDSCAGCHVKIDPPGFALENYDPSGKWRKNYLSAGGGGKGRQVIDASYEMPDGEPFDGIEEFKRLVLRQPERLAYGLTEKLATYGTGAAIRFGDREAIQRIVEQTSESGHGFRSLVEAVVVSPLFLSK